MYKLQIETNNERRFKRLLNIVTILFVFISGITYQQLQPFTNASIKSPPLLTATQTTASLNIMNLVQPNDYTVRDMKVAQQSIQVYSHSDESSQVMGSINANEDVSIIEANTLTGWTTVLLKDQYIGFVRSNALGDDKRNQYYIYIELGSFTVTIYEIGEDGQYSKIARQFATAIGKSSGMTPRGVFTLGKRERWHNFSGRCYAQYATRYANGLYFHSGLYRRKDPDTLIPDSYNAIGSKNTSGCFRMSVANSKWIYENCPEGTEVEIVSGSPKGTTSKRPKTISASVRRDPTDKETK
jgi:lipoprotein-anchoring transpeptidase ErfK/SrfK